MPLSGKKTEAGPYPGSDENQLTFIAEQVRIFQLKNTVFLG